MVSPLPDWLKVVTIPFYSYVGAVAIGIWIYIPTQTNTILLQFAKNELIISNERLGELYSLLVMYTVAKGGTYQLSKRYEAAGT